VPNPFNSMEFRQALGSFATGVTIVTTLGRHGEKVGMTVNSFNSVSLDPPLILWSLDRKTNCFEDFARGESFAVHVLAADQQDLSQRFASVGSDRFHDLHCTQGLSGTPILPHFSTCFECSLQDIYEGGDHVILVGKVIDFVDNQLPPLLFYRGQYKTL
jgi:flavin reductase (DIM6/NTAB) family NADH-FMN oxidoreductase RutF